MKILNAISISMYFAFATISSAQIVTNGSFETPQVGSGTGVYFPANASWTFGTAPGAGNGGGIISPPGFVPANGGNFHAPAAPSGSQIGFLQISNAYVTQIIFLPNNGVYNIAYKDAGRPYTGGVDGHGDTTYQIRLDSNRIAQVSTYTGQAFTQESFTFSATAGSHQLTFVIVSNFVYDSTVFFDAIAVTFIGPSLSIQSTNINEEEAWQYTPTVSSGSYTFGLSNAPSGMAINTNSGAISWTPTETQGPSTNIITYAVSQSGSVVAWTNFTVVVLESNVPPAFATWPGPQTVYATAPLSVQITATDSDIPANTLTYAIVSAPTGVSINSSSGLLSWTPTTGQVGLNTIYVSVTDYNPWAVNSQHLSVTNSFTVTVNALVPPSFLQTPTNQVVGFAQGFAFTSLATGYPPPTYQWQFSTDGVTFADVIGATGASFQLGSSSVTNLGYYRVVASNFVGTNTSAAVSLSFLNAKLLPDLILYGPVGANYNIQSMPALGGNSNWTTIGTVTLPISQPFIYVDPASLTNSQQFYRAVPQ